MIEEPETRRLLIDSCHSSAEAEGRLHGELQSEEFVGLLVRIAVDADDYQGDAPMQAAYSLSQADPSLLQPHEREMLALLGTADGYAGSVALALGRMQSSQAKPLIVKMLSAGCWPEHLYNQALSCYVAA